MDAVALDLVRSFCLALPQVEEKAGGDHAGFLVRSKAFAWYLNDHHGDGKIAICCKAAAGGQQILVGAEPERFFVPAYLGHRGWVSMRLDRPFEPDEVERLILESYQLIAPKRLVALLGRTS